jgi:outer membrane protein assembly factor BamB
MIRYVLLLTPCLLNAAIADANWPQFRGPDAAGVSQEGKPPGEFGRDKALAWKAAAGEGISSPIVWGDRVFITGAEAGRPRMICLSRRDGSRLWERELPAVKQETVHRTSHPVSATPATDGRRVAGYFPGTGLVVWDMEGKELWRKEMEMPFVVNGSGTSPIFAGERVVLCCDQQGGKSFLLAADAATGKTLWQTPRPLAVSSYTTPVLWKRGGGAEDIVVSGSLKVTGYNPADGTERWSTGGTEAVSVCPTPVVGNGRLYIMSRSFGEAPAPAGLEGLLLIADKDKSGGLSREESPFFQKDGIYDFIDLNRDGSITADELKTTTAHMKGSDFGLFALNDPGQATGTLGKEHTAWKHQKGTAKVATPLLYRDRLWVVADGGMVTCTDAQTGRLIFERQRLGGSAGGDYYASPVAAGDHIYLCSTRGVLSVLEQGDALKVTHTAELGAPVLATPAISGGLLMVRAGTELLAFGQP